jgi:hypothetical protein
MDIHKWLSETVLPRQPPSPLGQGETCHAPRPHELERAPREKHGRKQSSSDSSMLDARPQHKKAPPSGRVPPTEQEADETGHTDASHPTARSERSVSNEPYRRKPRRKTRPERYGPVANKSGSGIVQSFQAKNVPQERLTVSSIPVVEVYWWCVN